MLVSKRSLQVGGRAWRGVQATPIKGGASQRAALTHYNSEKLEADDSSSRGHQYRNMG